MHPYKNKTFEHHIQHTQLLRYVSFSKKFSLHCYHWVVDAERSHSDWVVDAGCRCIEYTNFTQKHKNFMGNRTCERSHCKIVIIIYWAWEGHNSNPFVTTLYDASCCSSNIKNLLSGASVFYAILIFSHKTFNSQICSKWKGVSICPNNLISQKRAKDFMQSNCKFFHFVYEFKNLLKLYVVGC